MPVNRSIILKEVLDCGYGDLYIIDDVENLEDILSDMSDNGEPITLNSILEKVFERGISEMEMYVNDRIRELEQESREELNEDDAEELKALKTLQVRKDIDYDCNCSASGIYFTNGKSGIYHEYFAQDLEEVEAEMGFCISG